MDATRSIHAPCMDLNRLLNATHTHKHTHTNVPMMNMCRRVTTENYYLKLMPINLRNVISNGGKKLTKRSAKTAPRGAISRIQVSSEFSELDGKLPG